MAYEADADYYVKLLRTVKIGPVQLRPDQQHQMKGSMIDQLLADPQYATGALEVGNKVEQTP